MPRRNGRSESAPPLDLTPADIPRPRHPQVLRPGEKRQSRAEREQEQAARQRKARMRDGIDWTVCLVPGCGEAIQMYGLFAFKEPELRDPEKVLPLCLDHQQVVWMNVQYLKHEPMVIEANTRVRERLLEKDAAEREAQKKRFAERRTGHIYFVRLNGLVKAGWSRDVHERLRAYGPLVEVLCIYPATRDDETNLHRQLRPVLARGREWYEDCKVVADFVTEAVEKHGAPVAHDEWTKPKQIIRPRKRSA